MSSRRTGTRAIQGAVKHPNSERSTATSAQHKDLRFSNIGRPILTQRGRRSQDVNAQDRLRVVRGSRYSRPVDRAVSNAHRARKNVSASRSNREHQIRQNRRVKVLIQGVTGVAEGDGLLRRSSGVVCVEGERHSIVPACGEGEPRGNSIVGMRVVCSNLTATASNISAA
jgi:hypothetical protein